MVHITILLSCGKFTVNQLIVFVLIKSFSLFLIVLLFAIVNAKSIDNHNVYITKLNMEQFKSTVQHSQSVWMIQIDLSGKPSEEFKKAAYLLRGIVKAGIIEEYDISTNATAERIPGGKVVFIHSEGVEDTFTNNMDINGIASKAMEFIKHKVEIQKKDNLKHYNPDNVKFLEFKSEQY